MHTAQLFQTPGRQLELRALAFQLHIPDTEAVVRTPLSPACRYTSSTSPKFLKKHSNVRDWLLLIASTRMQVRTCYSYVDNNQSTKWCYLVLKD
jgi:hypothetical protein